MSSFGHMTTSMERIYFKVIKKARGDNSLLVKVRAKKVRRRMKKELDVILIYFEIDDLSYPDEGF